MGEYVRQEAADLMDTSKIHGDIVEHYRKQADGKRAIVFAVTVAHSKHIAEAFRQAGIRAIHLDGETPRNERKLAARAFANGDIQVITNVGLFGEGYDLAAQADMDVTVDCVIDAQPTNSLAWCLQKWGRCLRPKADGSKAIILDHAANCLRHGLPDDYREWTLAGIDKKSRKAAEEEVKIKTRQCPKCYAIHRPMPICPECGHAYEINSRMASSFDYEILSGQYAGWLMEIKSVDWMVFKNDWIDGHPPHHIEIQVQHELAVSGRPGCIIAALVGGNDLKIIPRLADPEMAAMLIDAINKFWLSIESDTPPAPNFERDAEFLCRMYRHAGGEPFIATSADYIANLVDEDDALKAAKSRIEKRREEIKAECFTLIGTADAVIIDGKKRRSCTETAGSSGTEITSDMVGQIINARKPFRNWR